MKHDYSHLRFELSPTCNLSCTYCRSHSGAQYANPHGELSQKRIFALLDEAVELGFQTAVFTGGGEPFLRKDILDLINYGTLTKIVISNGTIFTRRHVEQLAASPTLAYIKISYDGPAQSEVRGASSEAKVLENIGKLTRAGIPIWINTVVSGANCYRLDELYQYIASCKIFGWGLYPIIAHGRAPERGLSTDIRELARSSAVVLKSYFEDGCPFEFEIEDLYSKELFDAIWPEHPIVADVTRHPCDYQTGAITVRLNGDISQCSRLRRVFGNVYEQGLTDILNGPTYQGEWLGQRIEMCVPCSTCRFASICAGGCTGRKQIEGWDLVQEPDYVACNYALAFEEFIVPVLPAVVRETVISFISEGSTPTGIREGTMVTNWEASR